jgi:hypothetical protein
LRADESDDTRQDDASLDGETRDSNSTGGSSHDFCIQIKEPDLPSALQIRGSISASRAVELRYFSSFSNDDLRSNHV